MAEGASIAIEIGRRTARAVWVSRRPSGSTGLGLTVRKTLTAEIPAELRLPGNQDSEALGSWLGDQLKVAGIPRGRVTFALPRELVGLKRMNLPTTEHAELPDMVRLAMQRELPFDAAGMAIDFIAQDQSATSTSVLAVALPLSALVMMQSVARSAGLTVVSITLTTIGAAKLVDVAANAVADPKPQSSLLIDHTGDGLELTVVINGAIRFSRAAEWPVGSNDAAITEAIVTETRRTWTSYRTADDAADADEVVLMGDPKIGELATEAITEITNARVRLLSTDGLVDAANSAPIERLWPLLGLLRSSENNQAQIDLADPRRAPDLAAQKRKRWLLAAAACVIGIGLLITAGNLNLKSLRAKAASLAQQESGGSAEYTRFVRDQYKLDHLRQWRSSRVDWLEQANYLMQFSPAPDQVVLDSWSGSIDPVDVRYDVKARAWRTPREVTIVLDGEARDRETADAFRNRLVNDSKFYTSSSGADTKGGKRLPFGFTYRLREQDIKKPATTVQPKVESGASAGSQTP